MTWFDRLRFRLGLLRRARLEQDFDDEMRFHLEELAAQHEARGRGREEAMRAARREFGIASTVKEDLREAHGINLLDSVLLDLRYGLRLLRRDPGFAASAFLTIALGIGTTTAVFTVVYGVVLRPLPYPEPDRLVALWTGAPRLRLPRAFVGAANYRDWARQGRSFESLALVRHIGNFNITGSGEPERLQGARLTASLFTVLRTPPALGRAFTPEDEQVGRDTVVILSDRLWARRFGRDAGVIGRTVVLNGEAHEIRGVMPPSFAYPSREFDLWVPLTINPREYVSRLDYNYLVIGRLRPGIALPAAQDEMRALSRRLEEQYPDTNADITAIVEPLRADLVRDVRGPLLLLLAAVCSVLLIGCASLANLLIARAASRSGELVLRAALGAGRARLVRQSITELVPLLVLGGAAGVALARLLLDAAVPWLPATMPRVEAIAIGAPVLLFAAAALALTAIATGVWPAMQVARWDVAAALRESLRGASTTLRGTRARDALVVTQIAVALLLTIAAALLARSFANVRDAEIGLRADGVATMHLAIPRAKYRDDWQVADVCGRILERVQQLPAVGAAGMVNRLPLSGGAQVGTLQVEGSALPDGRIESVDWRTVTPDYFHALSIPLIEGRTFTERDRDGAPLVGIIDERIARAAWPNQSAIGRRFRIPLDDLPWITVVGVVGHIRHDSAASEGRPQVYWNDRQRAQDRMALVVRAEADPDTITRSIVAAIRAVDPEQAVYDVRPMSDVVDRSLGQEWLTTAVLSAFAVVALLMAVVGVYGVVAYGVRQRAREFSVRVALGADTRDVLLIVLRRAAWLVAGGVAAGTAAGLLATRWLAALLYDVSPTDVASFAGAAGVLSLAALLATVVPARRAVNAEPMAVLRGE